MARSFLSRGELSQAFDLLRQCFSLGATDSARSLLDLFGPLWGSPGLARSAQLGLEQCEEPGGASSFLLWMDSAQRFGGRSWPLALGASSLARSRSYSALVRAPFWVHQDDDITRVELLVAYGKALLEGFSAEENGEFLRAFYLETLVDPDPAVRGVAFRLSQELRADPAWTVSLPGPGSSVACCLLDRFGFDLSSDILLTALDESTLFSLRRERDGFTLAHCSAAHLDAEGWIFCLRSPTPFGLDRDGLTPSAQLGLTLSAALRAEDPNAAQLIFSLWLRAYESNPHHSVMGPSSSFFDALSPTALSWVERQILDDLILPSRSKRDPSPSDGDGSDEGDSSSSGSQGQGGRKSGSRSSLPRSRFI